MEHDDTRTEVLTDSEPLSLHRKLAAHRQRLHVGEAQSIASPSKTATGTCWCISKGMAGMNGQTSGLAIAVGYRSQDESAPSVNSDSSVPDREGIWEFRHVYMKFPWSCMPVELIPRSNSILTDPSAITDGYPPRLVISCGRQGVVPALSLKKKLGNRIFTVHVQDPKCDTSGFDMVLIPKHDPTRGPNVELTMGALHKVTPERLEDARHSALARKIADPDRPLVTVLLGGKNGYYSFSRRDIDRLFDKLRSLVTGSGARLAILTSNRTPAEVRSRVTREFEDRHYIWNGDGPNPYFEALAMADYLVVTGDSVSMVTEATATGRPVFVEHLTERRSARRFRQFHEMFEEAGFTRKFEGRLDEWSYEPPNDTPRVARLIRERMEEQ